MAMQFYCIYSYFLASIFKFACQFNIIQPLLRFRDPAIHLERRKIFNKYFISGNNTTHWWIFQFSECMRKWHRWIRKEKTFKSLMWLSQEEPFSQLATLPTCNRVGDQTACHFRWLKRPKNGNASVVQPANTAISPCSLPQDDLQERPWWFKTDDVDSSGNWSRSADWFG